MKCVILATTGLMLVTEPSIGLSDELAATATSVLASDLQSTRQPDHVCVKHLDLDLAVDFENRLIRGSVTHDLERIDRSADLLLDTHDIKIVGVFADLGQSLPTVAFDLEPPYRFLGQLTCEFRCLPESPECELST